MSLYEVGLGKFSTVLGVQQNLLDIGVVDVPKIRSALSSGH